MKILVNVFHPDLDGSIVNANWVQALRQVSNVTLNLQYTSYPDWQFDIAREQQLLTEHDLIVFQFPFMWYSAPPLMKKWLDDVLTYGWAYGSNGKALKDKSVLLAVSTGCSSESYQAGGENAYSMSELLKPMQLTFELTQMKYLSPFVFHSAGEANTKGIAKSAVAYLARITDI